MGAVTDFGAIDAINSGLPLNPFIINTADKAALADPANTLIKAEMTKRRM